MHFVASCSQSRGKFSDDEYLLGGQYAAAPSVDRRSDPVTETAFTGSPPALTGGASPLCCGVASFVAVVIGALRKCVNACVSAGGEQLSLLTVVV